MEARLIFITDIERFGLSETLRVAECLCRSARPESVAIQLRDKQLSASERLNLAQRLRAITHRSRQFLLINDRVDIAVLGAADGVHLGEHSLDPVTLRAAFPALFLTCAWHGSEPRAGADAYLLSPVIAARKGAAALELDGLRRAVLSEPQRRVYALGGVDASNAAACLEFGAFGVAVIGAGYTEPERLIQALKLSL